MTKKPVITSVTSGYQGTETINSNFDSVREAFDNTLSLDGSTPNQMESDFDLNSYDILNAGTISTVNLVLDGTNILTLIGSGGSGGGGVTDGDKGDVIVSGSGLVWTVDPTLLAQYAPVSHTHDSRYYTETETDSLLSGKSDTGHTHSMSDITSGNLGVSRGGTGLTSTPTNGQVLIGNGTGYTLATLTAGPNVTITNSSGGISISAATTGGATLANGDYGDVVVSGTGTVMTIDTGVVNTLKLGGDITTAGKALLDDADASAQRTTLGLGSVATLSTVATTNLGGDITTAGKALLDDADASAQRTTLGLGSLSTLSTVSTTQLGGDITTAGKALLDDLDSAAQRTTLGLGALATLSSVGTSQIQDNSVSGAKIALGSDTQGDVMYYNGTDWARLGAGSTGQVLQTNGVGANPSWATVSGSGGGVTFTTYTTGSGNWTIPASGSVVFVRLWGGGGSGGRGGSSYQRAGGGGGGGYAERKFRLSDLGSAGATIAYVVGSGGAAVSVAGVGNPGNDSSFAYGTVNEVFAYGGGAGGGNTSTSGGGSGGTLGFTNLWDGFAGGAYTAAGGAAYHGGSGGGGSTSTTPQAGGVSYGSGGYGGAGAISGTATSGSTPGGGGGGTGSNSGTSGAGGNGRIEIWVW